MGHFLSLNNLLLPLKLSSFELDDTRLCLQLFSRKEHTQTFIDEALVQAIHDVTQGYPLYVNLVASAALRAEGNGKPLQPEEIRKAIKKERIEFDILQLLLREMKEKKAELIACSAPRSLDIATLRAIRPKIEDDLDAQERLDDYRRFTLLRKRASDDKYVFHPIVRKILQQGLCIRVDPKSDYYQTHTRLLEHFHEGNEQASLEEAYHALALGNPDLIIKLGIASQQGNVIPWEKILEVVSQAPTELRSANIEQQAEYKRPHYHLQDGVRAIIHYSWLLPTLDRTSEKAALLQRSMGRVYCDLQGRDQQANLQRAIDCYERALEVFTRPRFPSVWATTQLDLGEAYSLLRRKDRQATKHKALACYEKALQVCDEQTYPIEWARAKNNIGEALSDVPGEDQQANLQKAIISYQEALHVRTQVEFPFEWAITQNNLGNAFSHLSVGDRKANVQNARKCYQDAHLIHTQEKFPVEWARAWNNLGNAYRNLAENVTSEDQKVERQQNLEEAITCFKTAFQVRTQEQYPIDWATTQHNLGLAYNLLSGNSENDEEKQQESFQLAIGCFKAALDIYTQEAYPMDWARTKSALGNAYRFKQEKKEEKEKQREKLQLAVAYYKEALQVYTRASFPKEWAKTCYYLGLAYAYMPGMPEKELVDRQSNLQQAIICYEEALLVYSQEAYPADWAKTQRAMGNAYRLLPLGDRRDNLQRANKHFKLASVSQSNYGMRKRETQA